MRKGWTDADFAGRPQRAGAWGFKVVAIVLIGVLLAPLFIELASLYYAKWNTIMGKSTNDVRTPIVEWIQTTAQMTYGEIFRSDSGVFRNLANSPKTILPIAVITIAIAMRWLRKSVHTL